LWLKFFIFYLHSLIPVPKAWFEPIMSFVSYSIKIQFGQ
jgi:hypothetical protein